MYKLVLIRHGESIWNKENKFTGWTDIDLSERGAAEAKRAGEILKKAGFTFDLAYTSVLKRAVRTLSLILGELELSAVPIQRTWRLNERHYGALQGLNKSETARIYGDKQVQLWRRSYEIKPPALDQGDPRYPGNDPKYKELPPIAWPLTESLADTIQRVMPCWQKEIIPQIKAGKRVIISAHGNSLRALVKHLEDLNEQQVVELEIPLAVPIVYVLDSQLKPLQRYCLADFIKWRITLNISK